MIDNASFPSILDRITKKNLDRFSMWIIIALAGIYILSFPIHKSAILVVIPVVATGWFYGIQGGWIAGVAAILLDLLLINTYQEKIIWEKFLYYERDNFFLLGHFFMFIAGISAGRLRETVENYTRIESELRASEERFRSLYENATIGIYSTTSNGQILLANPALVHMLGYDSFDELAACNLEKEGFHPEHPRSRFQEIMEKDGIIKGYESVWTRKDGSPFYVRESAKAIRDSKGGILRYEGIIEDITERQLAETTAREIGARFRAVVENSSNGIIFMSADRRIIYASSSYEQFLGFTAEEISGHFDLEYVCPEDRDFTAQKFSELLQTPGGTVVIEYRLQRKDGSHCWVETTAVNLLENPYVQAVVLNQRDINERKRAENEMLEGKKFLALLNDMTKAIISAHDFKEVTDILINNITTLLEADSSYITKWDPIKQQVLPVATNSKDKNFFMNLHYPKGGKNLTVIALEQEQIVIVEDISTSPYINQNLLDPNHAEKSYLSIPLIYGGQKLGAAVVGFNEEHLFTKEEMERASQAGGQIALAMWNMLQDGEAQRHLRETQTLADIAQALSETESIGLNNLLNLIVASARDLIANAEQAVIHLLDETGQVLTSQAVAGFAEFDGGKRNIHVGKGIAGQVIASGETINIADVNNDPRFIKLGTEPSYRSLLVAPVRSGERKLGTISIQSSQSYAFTPNDIKLISQLGTQAAIAIENAHLLENTQQSLKESNALYRINQGLVASLEPDNLLQDTVDLLQKNFDYHYVQIFVADPDSGHFIMRAGSGKIGAQLKAREYQLAPGEGIVGYTAETSSAFFTNDVDDAVSYVRNPLLPDTKSELAVPVKIGSEILGLLDIHQVPPKYLSQRDLQLVSAVADQLAVALQKADLYESLQISLQQEKAIRNQLMQNERLTVMGRLLATVSHELNNPLQAIQNALFLLKEETGISAQGKQDLNIVLAESERMAGMIERLRDTYRPIQADDFQPTQINDIVEDVYALTSTHLRHKQIAFEFHPDAELPEIPALADQVRQVVLNLLMNAVEAMPNGGSINVSTEFIKSADEILITIADNGPGIPPDLLPNIFEAFITSKQTGTGLGLTISYDIIMKHRGRITAENNRNHGAVFKIWLPTNNGEIL